jgi:hypothetical protein
MEKKRYGFKWNVNEVLQLQREYELLGMSIEDIAKSHNRSCKAVLCKLEREGFIEDWSFARGIEEFIESDNELRQFKSLILNGYNLNNNNNNNNCEIVSNLTTSETTSETVSVSEESIDKTDSNVFQNDNPENIVDFNIRNMFLMAMNLLYVIFQFVEENFSNKIVF